MKLRPLSAIKLIRILRKLGFEKTRQRGSHIFMRHEDGRTTVIPIHGGEEIDIGLLRDIIREIKLTRKQFLKLLKK